MRIPKVSSKPVPIPRYTSREDEVLLLSLFYKNNLLRDFLFTVNQCTSPWCKCLEEEQTAFHLVSSCPLVDAKIRKEATEIMVLWNEVTRESDLPADFVSVLNCSRDPDFIALALRVVKNKELGLLKEIRIRR